MGRKNNHQIAKTPDEIKVMLTPLLQNLRQSWTEQILESTAQQISMLEEELQPVRKQNMRSQSKRKKKTPEHHHIKKLYIALAKGGSGKKEDIEATIKTIVSFDKKYRPETPHDHTIKRVVKNILGIEKLSHKFNFTAEDKQNLAQAFKVIAEDLLTSYPSLKDREEKVQQISDRKSKNMPRSIRGEHLLDRYVS